MPIKKITALRFCLFVCNVLCELQAETGSRVHFLQLFHSIYLRHLLPYLHRRSCIVEFPLYLISFTAEEKMDTVFQFQKSIDDKLSELESRAGHTVQGSSQGEGNKFEGIGT